MEFCANDVDYDGGDDGDIKTERKKERKKGRQSRVEIFEGFEVNKIQTNGSFEGGMDDG